MVIGLLALELIECGSICAFDLQNKSAASDETTGIYSAGDEEYNVYNSAINESNPQKRAAKLYEFIQKYPRSPFIKLISNENYEGIRLVENELNAYYSAKQEPDIEKRAARLIEFSKKYPTSISREYVENDYTGLLNSLQQDKNYELVYSLGEKWLTTTPNDRTVNAFVGNAAMQLHKYQRCGECLEAVYGSNPSSTLAREIQACYQKANNQQKMIEWAEKLFKMPEFENDYMLRYECALFFYNGRNFPKAINYARLALKSIDSIKQPDKAMREQLQQAHRACHHIIASSLVDTGNFTEAISEYEKAIEVEKYSQGYYGIGFCFDNEKNVEEAMLYYAAAELMDGNTALKAKERLELLYKAIHNDTLVGIDKVYTKAKKLLESQNS